MFNLLSEYLKSLNKQAIATVVQVCILPVLMVLFIAGMNQSIFRAYAYSSIIIMLLALFLSYWTIKPDTKSVKSELEVVNNFWADSKAFLVVGVLNIIMNSMDVLMLGVMTNSDTVAEYGIANKLVAISSVILVVVNGIVGPRFAELWRNEQLQKLKQYFYTSAILMALFSIVIMLFFIFLGEQLLTGIYGLKYAASYKLLIILALGQIIVLATGPVAYLLMMTNYKHIHQRSLCLAVFINVLLNISLIPSYGAIGAAVATAVGLIVKNIYSFYNLLVRVKLFSR